MINIYPFRITQRNRLWKPAHLNYMVYTDGRYYVFKSRGDAFEWLEHERRAYDLRPTLCAWAIKRTKLRKHHYFYNLLSYGRLVPKGWEND